jgi:hypothetical protein
MKDSEVKARLRAIESGPWRRRARFDRPGRAAPSFPNRPSIQVYFPIAPIPGLPVPATSASAGDLPYLGVFADTESEDLKHTQSSLEDAIVYLQIVNLALETGYLPREELGGSLQKHVDLIFTPEPARRRTHPDFYLRSRPIVARLNLERFLGHRKAPTESNSAVHFASFLAADRALERDPYCAAWNRFLFGSGKEYAEFRTFLRSGSPPRTRRQMTLVFGGQRFASMLADFFVTLPGSVRPRFGALYGDQLSYFLGESPSRGTAQPGSPVWPTENKNWADEVKAWIARAPLETTVDEREAVLNLYCDAVNTLREVWSQVRGNYQTVRVQMSPQQSFTPS